LTLDHVTGEVAELEPFNALMSERGAQVEKNLAALEAAWVEGHPGETMSRTTAGRLRHKAWAQDRSDKKPRHGVRPSKPPHEHASSAAAGRPDARPTPAPDTPDVACSPEAAHLR
jgi:hypothetical protein